MDDAAIVAVVFRGVERLFIVAGAFFSLWLSLKFSQATGQSSGQIKWEKLSIELKKIGPSVFFALFGVVLFGFSVYNSLQFSSSSNQVAADGGGTSSQSKFQYFGLGEGANASLNNLARDAGAIGNFKDAIEGNRLTSNDRGELVALINRIVSYRRQLFEIRFGAGSRALFDDYLSRDCDRSADERCSEIRKKIGKDIPDMEKFGAT